MCLSPLWFVWFGCLNRRIRKTVLFVFSLFSFTTATMMAEENLLRVLCVRNTFFRQTAAASTIEMKASDMDLQLDQVYSTCAQCPSLSICRWFFRLLGCIFSCLFMSGWRYWFFHFRSFGAFDFFDFFVRLWVLFFFFSVTAVSWRSLARGGGFILLRWQRVPVLW